MIEKEFSKYIKKPLKKQEEIIEEVSYELKDYKLLYDNINKKTEEKIKEQKKLLNLILEINNNIDNLENKVNIYESVIKNIFDECK